MSTNEQLIARAYEAMRQQQSGAPTQAPAWTSLTPAMRKAIVATAVYAWGQGHQEGLEATQRQRQPSAL